MAARKSPALADIASYGGKLASMKTSRALLFGIALAASATAFAQYQWTDKDGRKVFSDRPPPADVPASKVITQPRAVPVASAASEGAASAPAQSASAPGAGVDKSLEEKRKKAEAEEAARKKAEQDRIAAERADNCKRAMNNKSMLDSGMRMARMNDKGEREVLDDNQRAAETARVNEIIAKDCK